jgi:hypothetical protein
LSRISSTISVSSIRVGRRGPDPGDGDYRRNCIEMTGPVALSVCGHRATNVTLIGFFELGVYDVALLAVPFAVRTSFRR